MTTEQMTETKSEKGRAGREANAGIAELWWAAEELNNEHGTEEGEYVPIRALVLDDTITPRDDISAEVVDRYEEILDELPPVVVQKDTFVLIDGRHRLEAHLGMRDHIRIVEEEVPEDVLFLRAVQENTRHGAPLTSRERERAGKRIIVAEPQMTDPAIAEICGVSATKVAEWRRDLAEPEPAPKEPAAKKRKVRASLDWMDEAIADMEEGPGAVAAEVDTEALEGHLAQARRFREHHVGSLDAWVGNYITALQERLDETPF